MKRALSALAGVAAGGLLAASGLFGAASSTESAPRSEPLQVGDYCRELHGDDATVYRPTDLGGWRCSVWRNGVWGLEPLDLNAACRWQRGDDARLAPVRGTVEGSERALACTL